MLVGVDEAMRKSDALRDILLLRSPATITVTMHGIALLSVSASVGGPTTSMVKDERTNAVTAGTGSWPSTTINLKYLSWPLLVSLRNAGRCRCAHSYLIRVRSVIITSVVAHCIPTQQAIFLVELSPAHPFTLSYRSLTSQATHMGGLATSFAVNKPHSATWRDTQPYRYVRLTLKTTRDAFGAMPTKSRENQKHSSG